MYTKFDVITRTDSGNYYIDKRLACNYFLLDQNKN